MKVELVKDGVLGNDLLVANVARKSFGAGYEEWSEVPRTARGRSDRQLVLDLAKDGHWLPFRHPKIILTCDSPIPIARQLGKHQVGMDWSEISRRYKTKDILFYRMNSTWRSDVKDRRQGSGELLPDHIQNELNLIEDSVIIHCLNSYNDALELGASPEQARFLLPQSMEVSWTWTGSLLAWAHMYHQRTHPDAQKETRDFAEQVGSILQDLFPVSWEALTKKKD
jgi:thymidylate synthase (FAD)